MYEAAAHVRRKTARMKRIREGLEIPVTEDEVVAAERSLEGVSVSPLPEWLKEPPTHLLPEA